MGHEKKGKVKNWRTIYGQIKSCIITILLANINSSCNDYSSYKGSAANHRMVIENLINVILKGDNVATSGEEGSRYCK